MSVARGWESKSVEEQQEAAREARQVAGPERSPSERAAAQAHEALRLNRARILGDLQRACQPAHRAMLEAALHDVEHQLLSVGREERD
jgi:hypothetical protein